MATKAERRSVTFQSLDEVLAQAEECATRQAETLGNWSLGQIFEHLARTFDKSIDGFEARSPLYMRFVAKWFLKKRFLRDGLPSGFQLKGKSAKELVPVETLTEEGLAHLRTAIERITNEEKRSPHPAFGVMTREEWDTLHLRHCELHMSFVSD